MIDLSTVSASPAFTSTATEKRALTGTGFGIETIAKQFNDKMATKNLMQALKK